MRPRLVIGVLNVVLGAAIAACSTGAPTNRYSVPRSPVASVASGFRVTGKQQTSWLLDHISANNETVVVRVAEGGCASYDHSKVTETKNVVTVVTWNRSISPSGTGPSACALILTTHAYAVVLRHPLAGRTLLGGCTPSDASAEGRTCTALQSGARFHDP